jgi:hypothetical protein
MILRRERLREIVQRLAGLGISLDEEKVVA